ncbi:MAG: NUDIX domain-containing protein [Candidatus Woesearchaeota archaeon]|jgi:isopentenyldiphosphate isomerase
MKKEEQIIEVDENDKFLRMRNRSDFYSGKYIHRGSQLILKNSKGQILLQKRSKDKKWFPNLLNFSAGGTVENETYRQNIIKETQEEIGIKINPKKLFKIRLNIDNDNAYHSVFIATSDNKITIQKEEVQHILWVDESDLKKDITVHPKKYTPVFVEGMKKYFALK